MNKDQENKEQQKPQQQPQQTESIKLKQQKQQQDYSKGNRTCMATGQNGIDFLILASIVQQQHSNVVNQVIQQLDSQ